MEDLAAAGDSASVGATDVQQPAAPEMKAVAKSKALKEVRTEEAMDNSRGMEASVEEVDAGQDVEEVFQI